MKETTFLYHVFMITGKHKEWIFCTCCTEDHFQKRFKELQNNNPGKQFTYDKRK